MKPRSLFLGTLLSIFNFTHADSFAVSPTPNLGTGRTVYRLAQGDGFSCALLDNALVKCWGRNDHGQLGYGDAVDRRSVEQMGDTLPYVDLGTARTVVDLAVGKAHACVILDDASVKCWGSNEFGQLGVGPKTYPARGDQSSQMGDALAPVPLGTGRTAMRIAAGDTWSCAALDNGTSKCWGTK